MPLPLDDLLRDADRIQPRALLARLKALDWGALDVATDAPVLRRILQRLEARYGVRPTHRYVSRKVLEASAKVRVHHAFKHVGPLSAVSVSPDGALAITASNYSCDLAYSPEVGHLQWWDVAAGRAIARPDAIDWGLGTHMPGGTNIAQWSPDGRHVAVSASSSSVYVWSVADKTAESHRLLDDSGIGSELKYAWSPDGTRVAFPLGEIRRKPIEYVELPEPGANASCQALRPLGERSEGDDEGGPAAEGSFYWLAWSASLPRVVAASRDEVWLIDATTGALTNRIGRPIAKGGDNARASLDPAGRVVVCARRSALVAIDLATERVLVELHPRASRVYDARWDRRGDLVAVVTRDECALWRPGEGACVARLPRTRDRAPSRTFDNRYLSEPVLWAFNAQGTMGALVGGDGRVTVFDEQWRPAATLATSPRTIATAFGAGDQVLVTWGEDVVEFWDLGGLWSGRKARRIGRYDHTGFTSMPVGRSYRAEYAHAYVLADEVRAVGPLLREGEAAEDDAGEGEGDDEDDGASRERCGWAERDPEAPWVVAWRERGGAFACAAFFADARGRAVFVHPPGRDRALREAAAFVLDDAIAWPAHWARGTRWLRAYDHWSAVASHPALPAALRKWLAPRLRKRATR